MVEQRFPEGDEEVEVVLLVLDPHQIVAVDEQAEILDEGAGVGQLLQPVGQELVLEGTIVEGAVKQDVAHGAAFVHAVQHGGDVRQVGGAGDDHGAEIFQQELGIVRLVGMVVENLRHGGVDRLQAEADVPELALEHEQRQVAREDQHDQERQEQDQRQRQEAGEQVEKDHPVAHPVEEPVLEPAAQPVQRPHARRQETEGGGAPADGVQVGGHEAEGGGEAVQRHAAGQEPEHGAALELAPGD